MNQENRNAGEEDGNGSRSAGVSPDTSAIENPTQEAARETQAAAAGTAALQLRPVSLVDMSIGQLTDAFRSLDTAQVLHEKLSGICATLKGLVLAEVKAKIGHGYYRAWLKDNFPKSIKTAERYKRLADEFGKSDSLSAFDILHSDLLTLLQKAEQAQLDLSHPLVKKVAKWVNGRGAYQLYLDIGPGDLGGNHHPKCPHCAGNLGSKTQAICPHCKQPTGLVADEPEGSETARTRVKHLWDVMIDEIVSRGVLPGHKDWPCEIDKLLLPDLEEIEARLAGVRDHFRDLIKGRKGDHR